MSNTSRKRIAVVGVGGTIAGGVSESIGYRSGQLTVEQILATLPDVSDWVELTAQQLANVGSQTIDYAIWSKLSQQVQALADSGEVDAVVITHGTDTLEETAYFLNLTVDSAIPIVLTGAMRPAFALGADGPANLYSAIAVATYPGSMGRGALVVMNEQIHAARNVQKMAASGIGAFASPNGGPVGRVQGREVNFCSNSFGFHTHQSDFAPLGHVSALLVPILYSHGDMDVRVVNALLGLKPAGIVLAGVGGGNTSDSTLAVLAQAAVDGVVVVRASRTGSGCVARNLEIDDDLYGFVAARDLNPQKARVLLMLALQQTRDINKLQAYFSDY